jgi:hypothetical protein
MFSGILVINPLVFLVIEMLGVETSSHGLINERKGKRRQ